MATSAPVSRSALCTPVFRPEGLASVLAVIQGKIGRSFHATEQANLYGRFVGR